MITDVQIINLGLNKIGSAHIRRIDPPQTSMEKHCASGYVHWKNSELTKRRWVFATETEYVLAKVADPETLRRDDGRNYKYSMPNDCMRLIRTKHDEWLQNRKFVYSCRDGLKVSYIARADESEFDPLFIDVLAARIAVETCEYDTQSNTKKADARSMYVEAVTEAGRSNAFVIGPEDIRSDDDDFEFITGRY